MHSLSEVASLLGCRDPRRITKCMQIAGIDPETLPQPPQDRRVRLLSDAQVEQIRTAYAHLYGPKPTDTGDLEARLAAVEKELAALKEHSPWLFRAPTEARVATDVQLPPYVPPRRLTATTASHSRTSRPPIPEGMLGVKEWARQHRIPETTAKRHVKDGDVPAVHGEWQRGSAIFKQLLAAEGQAAAHRLWGFGDPCRVCGWSSERALPATSLAVVAGSYEVDDEGS